MAKGASVTAASEAGITPLMVLAASGSLSGTKLLLETAQAGGGAPAVAAMVDATTENGTAALHTAARQARAHARSRNACDGRIVARAYASSA